MPPYEVCKISADCLKLCDELVICGNKNLITDTAIAAICLEGAFFSAKFNVYINLKYIFVNYGSARLLPLYAKILYSLRSAISQSKRT